MKSLLTFLMALFSLSQFAVCSLFIDGDFNGWEGETVVKLSDGTFWIQSEYHYNYCYAFNPEVDLYKEHGRIKILVKGCDNEGVEVQRLTNVIESKIDGEFKGFDGETIFKLMDGSIWKQKNYKYWYKYAYNPSCIVYHYNGWKLSVFGKTIDVERVTFSGYSDNNYNSSINIQPTSTFIKVQNNTDKLLYFCYSAYNGSNGWQSNGWYKVDPYSNTTIDIGYYIGNIYLYAEYNAGESAWFDSNSKYSFCIDKTNAFNIPNADIRDCSNSNYKRVKMYEFSVSPGIFTWTLNP